MGAVALERMQNEGIDLGALKERNRATIGGKYDRLWYQSKINDYQILLTNLTHGAKT
jgi:hypothetical protein